MANFTAADIKALRERTGAGMMDVKKALDEANGDADKALELIRFRHPFYERFSPVYLAEFVETGAGTGIVHSSPAYGVDDFISCKAHGMKDDDILNPVMGDGRYIGEGGAGGVGQLPALGGQAHAAGVAQEQAYFQHFFQPAHMVADRAGGQVQLLRGLGEVLVARGDREHGQCGEQGRA